MVLLLGIILSSLSFASGPFCHALWDSPKVGFTFDLQKVVTAERNESLELKNIFTNDHQHNAALVNLLLLKPGVDFKVEVNSQTYLDQVRLFDILRQNSDITVIVDNQVLTNVVHQPIMKEIQWMRRTARQYLRERQISENIDSVSSYYDLLDFYLNANP